jgi:predicted ATPase
VIEKASFTNFKSLRRVDVDLRRFMVIVGPNGSGKTSILEGIDYLARTTWSALGIDPPNLKSRGSTEPMVLAFSGRFHDVEVDMEVVSVCEDDAQGRPKWGAAILQRWGDQKQRYAEGERGLAERAGGPNLVAPGAREVMAPLFRELGSARRLRLDVEKLASPSYSHDEIPRMAFDGDGLASVLSDMAGRLPETLHSITQAARKVVPGLERIRTRRAQVKPDYWGQQVVLDFNGAGDVPAPLASEGTLLVIGLLTALWTEPRPRVLLLDDIDKALHPRAQGELVAQLRKVLEMDPELQIIATSHSPYLLDHFDAEDVLITALHPDGSTACAPLTAHPDFERWKQTTHPGELWSFLGEDWVTQQAHG